MTTSLAKLALSMEERKEWWLISPTRPSKKYQKAQVRYTLRLIAIYRRKITVNLQIFDLPSLLSHHLSFLRSWTRHCRNPWNCCKKLAVDGPTQTQIQIQNKRMAIITCQKALLFEVSLCLTLSTEEAEEEEINIYQGTKSLPKTLIK